MTHLFNIRVIFNKVLAIFVSDRQVNLNLILYFRFKLYLNIGYRVCLNRSTLESKQFFWVQSGIKK